MRCSGEEQKVRLEASGAAAAMPDFRSLAHHINDNDNNITSLNLYDRATTWIAARVCVSYQLHH